jgi:hypothetical protein
VIGLDAEEFKVQKFNVQSLNGECLKTFDSLRADCATLDFEAFLLDRQRVVVLPLTIGNPGQLFERAD